MKRPCKQCGVLAVRFYSYGFNGGTGTLCLRCAQPPKRERPACRHCGQRKVCRPRGLCWPCYNAPRVRERYPVSRHPGSIRHGVGMRHDDGERLPEPTSSLPQTEEKILALTDRARRGESLWHPDDARMSLK